MAPKPSAYKRNDDLLKFAQPSRRKGWISILTSALPYLALFTATYLTLGVSLPLTLALEVLAAGFLVRTFVIFHDCTHGSLLPTKRENTIVGRVLGVIVLSPFARWRKDHITHHAHAGDLDQRGAGDVATMTVTEYQRASNRTRLTYRLGRSPLMMLTVGPIIAMIVGPRIMAKDAKPEMRKSVRMTNLALAVIIGGLCLLMGWQDFLIVWAPPALMAGAAGIFLFYVQHQHEDAYWKNTDDWSYTDAALQGSSYLKLPAILNFFSANIGLHHVHHLNPRVPSYNLQRAHASCAVFASVPVLTLADGFRAFRLKLWDEDTAQLVTFAEARSRVVTPAAAQPLAARA